MIGHAKNEMSSLTFVFLDGSMSPPFGTYTQEPEVESMVEDKHIRKICFGLSDTEYCYFLVSVEMFGLNHSSLLSKPIINSSYSSASLKNNKKEIMLSRSE